MIEEDIIDAFDIPDDSEGDIDWLDNKKFNKPLQKACDEATAKYKKSNDPFLKGSIWSGYVGDSIELTCNFSLSNTKIQNTVDEYKQALSDGDNILSSQLLNRIESFVRDELCPAIRSESYKIMITAGYGVKQASVVSKYIAEPEDVISSIEDSSESKDFEGFGSAIFYHEADNSDEFGDDFFEQMNDLDDKIAGKEGDNVFDELHKEEENRKTRESKSNSKLLDLWNRTNPKG